MRMEKGRTLTGCETFAQTGLDSAQMCDGVQLWRYGQHWRFSLGFEQSERCSGRLEDIRPGASRD